MLNDWFNIFRTKVGIIRKLYWKVKLFIFRLNGFIKTIIEIGVIDYTLGEVLNKIKPKNRLPDHLI